MPLFDLAGDFVIRTPKRNGAYAAQVWGRAGFWLVGRFPTRHAARQAGHAFAAADPVEPLPGAPRPPNWVRRRSDSHAPRHLWVRRVKGGAWQARPWLGPEGGSLNLGLFTVSDHGDSAEWAAAQVAKAFAREWKAGRTVGAVVELLKRAPRAAERVPGHVVVPDAQRGLTPPVGAGPTDTAAERRERRRRARERKRYKGGTLLDAA